MSSDMSTNSSIILYQGRRCKKVPRQPRATDPPSTTKDPTRPSTDHDAPEETAAPDPASSTESITAVPKPTSSDSDSDSSSTQAQDHTSSEPSETHSTDPDDLYGTTPTDTSLSHTTFTTSTTTSSDTNTSLSKPIQSTSDDDSSGPPYATIFGVLFGVLGLIALIIILFFFRRRSRRNSTGSEPGGWSVQKLLPSGRGTPDSTATLQQDYRPPMSYLADASPTSSKLYEIGAPTQSYFDKPAQTTQTRNYQVADQHQKPFSDSAEVTHLPQSSIVPFMMRSSAMDPDSNPNSDPTRPAESYAPYRDRDPDRDSMQSGTSLGSTLVLPGRSSAGSNYQGMLFPEPLETGSSFQRGTVRGYESGNRHGDTNGHMGMSMYDLGVDADRDRERPQISASRRSSGTIPIALI